ncbi:helix-turn-helix domain-containing protein [Paracoccus sp. P2]|uniref:helix-turn-helix domain-containing protein n=1 Tax=Paracoccus sp. P2 TaxID=3248840 RepID=UPI00391EEA21
MAKSIYDEEYRRLINAIRSTRKEAGLTQQMLADRLGRPQSFVAKVEGYERRLDIVEFLHVCRALGVEPASIFAAVDRAG